MIGRIVTLASKPRAFLADRDRKWKVIKDPSGLFIGGLFRFADLKAGGFDRGTVFEHIHTGVRMITRANGILRKSKGHENSTSLRRATRTTLQRPQASSGCMHAARTTNKRLSTRTRLDS